MGKAVVTGAAGFLGSHISEALLREGWDVTGVDNLSQGRERNLAACLNSPRFRFAQADVRDHVALAAAAAGAELVVHMAAFKIPRYGGRVQTLEINALGTRNALEVAKQLGARFVFASTSDCYGKNPNVPFAESHDLVLGPSDVARWAYAMSKGFCEHLCLGYSEEFDVPVAIIRYFGSYGPRHHLSWWGGPQSVFIDLALRNQPLTVHGDGSQTRSFTYVKDAVAGTMTVLEASADKTRGQIVNVGTDEEISIVQLAHLIWRLVRGHEEQIGRAHV